jgi:hypothetical protein
LSSRFLQGHFKISDDMNHNKPLEREDRTEARAGSGRIETSERDASREADADYAIDPNLLDFVKRALADDPDDQAAWEIVRTFRSQSGWSDQRVADHFGIGVGRLVRRVRLGCWTREVPVKACRGRPRVARPDASRPLTKRERLRASGMLRRLYQALDHKITLLEQRMASAVDGGAPQSAADIERDARSLNGFARLYAKLVELDEAARREQGEGTQARSQRSSEDADRLRRDLALRLQRLNQKRDA